MKKEFFNIIRFVASTIGFVVLGLILLAIASGVFSVVTNIIVDFVLGNICFVVIVLLIILFTLYRFLW